MRKAMRVSAVFVGTAAMAAGFGPAAWATQASHIQSTNNCDTANKNWAEVSVKGDPFNRRFCSAFGFRGETQVSIMQNGVGSPNGIDHVGQCGGNNYGGFPWVNTRTLSYGFLTFGPGTYFRDITAFRSRISNDGNEIKISGWTGHDKCP